MQRKRLTRSRPQRHKTWQLQEAKARFSELVNEVIENSYQTIMKNGRPVAVIISHDEFQKLNTPKKKLGEFLSESPFSKYDLDLERDKDIGKEGVSLFNPYTDL